MIAAARHRESVTFVSLAESRSARSGFKALGRRISMTKCVRETLASILRQAGLTVDDLRDLL
jgi:hypothetical protein